MASEQHARGLPRIAISMGDPNGIGPEVALRCVSNRALRDRFEAVMVGSRAVLEEHARVLGLAEIPCEVLEVASAKVRFGAITREAGACSMQAVEKAGSLCLDGTCQAMVTAPISKEAIGLAGYAYPGHTEFLGALCNETDYLMMLVSGGLRVGVVTGHIPLSAVAGAITIPAVSSRLRRMAASLRADFGLSSPRIAVLGLNPHAGDGGVLGHEEAAVIAPAMADAAESATLEGPFPADGFFAEKRFDRYDAVLAMYHDQGLIPFKTLAFDTGVNFTAGLPIVRTSPDHGTAFDIAGKAIARPDSMANALRVAAEIATVRMANGETA